MSSRSRGRNPFKGKNVPASEAMPYVYGYPASAGFRWSKNVTTGKQIWALTAWDIRRKPVTVSEYIEEIRNKFSKHAEVGDNISLFVYRIERLYKALTDSFTRQPRILYPADIFELGYELPGVIIGTQLVDEDLIENRTVLDQLVLIIDEYIVIPCLGENSEITISSRALARVMLWEIVNTPRES